MKTYKKLLATLLIAVFGIISVSSLYAQCTNSAAFGSAVAPTGATVTTITTCAFTSEYSTVSSVVAGNRYVITATGSLPNLHITVRFSTPAGAVVASGISPLQFTAPCSGTYFVHYNSDAACGTASAGCVTGTIACVSCGATANQCTNSSPFGSGTAPTTVGTPVTLTSCAFAGEYSTINSVAANTVYRLTASIAGTFITIRQGSPSGTVIASGITPLIWSSTVAGTYYSHYNTNITCGTASSCITAQISFIAGSPCAAPPTGCTNSAAFGSGTLPGTNAIITLTTCAFAGEYSTVFGAVSGQTLQFAATASYSPVYLTVRSGTFNGPVVAAGNSPLTFVNTFTGTLFVHYNTNSSCGTLSTCHTGTVQCTSCPPPAPANDLCAGATTIACGGSVSGTTVGATADANACGGASSPGVWYQITPAFNSNITLSLCTGTTYDSRLSVYAGCGGAMVGCNDDFCGLQSQVTFNATAGTNYRILVNAFSTGSGPFTLTATCAPIGIPNDACAGAIAIPCGGTATGTTVGATSESTPCGSFASPGVWYSIVPVAGTGSVTASLCGSSYDTWISAYSGTCAGLTCLASNDDFCGLQSQINFNVTPGQTYYILVNGFSSSAGAFTLTTTCNAFDPCASILPSAACGSTNATTISGGSGAWAFGPFLPPGREVIYTYTPPATGNYTITQITSTVGSWVDYFFKPVSAGCNNTGWTFIQDLNGNGLTTGAIPMTAGVQYYILLDPENTAGGTVNWQINCAVAAPANDQCTAVTPVTVLPGGSTTFTGTTAGATTTNDGAFTANPTVWHAFTLTGCADVTLSYCGNNPAFGNIWLNLATACPPTTFTPAGTFNNTSCTSGLPNYQVTWLGLAAGTYYVPIMGLSTTPGFTNTPGPYSVTLLTTACPPPPPNDVCINAIPISCGGSVSGNTSQATNDVVPCGSSNKGIWYSLTLPTSGIVTLSTCGSSFDTWLSIYSGTCGALTCIANNDDFCGLQSQITTAILPAGTYYIMVSGFGTSSGAFTLNVTCVLCSSPPVGGTASGPTSGCTGGQLAYTLTGYSGSIQWQVSTSSITGPYSNIAGATLPNLMFSPTIAGTNYLRAELSGGSACTPAYSNVITISVTDAGAVIFAAATPNPVCEGISVNLSATGCPPATSGFAGDFAPGTWAFSNQGAVASTPGYVTTTSAPASILIHGPDNAPGSSWTQYMHPIVINGTVAFNWSYTTIDGPVFDQFQYTTNGGGSWSLVPGFSTSGASTQSGTASIPVASGAVFGWRIHATDGCCGWGESTISNFSFTPNCGSGGGGSTTVSNFTGTYAPASWTSANLGQIASTPGFVNTSGAPASILIHGPDNAPGSSWTQYTHPIPASGNVQFNWNYNTIDGPSFDQFDYTTNGGSSWTNVPGFSTGGGASQSGTATIPVTSGSVFGWRIHATDGCCGWGEVTISNFSAPDVGGGPPVTITGYSWVGNGGFSASTQNAVIVGTTMANAGLVTVYATLSNGCTIGSSVNLSVLPAPNQASVNPINSSPVCVGDVILFSSSGGVSYSWSGPGSLIGAGTPTPQIGSATMADNGTYTVTVTNSFGCSGTATTNVTVYELPVPYVITSSNPTCLGYNDGEIVVGSSGASPFFFDWGFNNDFGVTATISNLTAGNYTISVVDDNGCSSNPNLDVLLFDYDPIPPSISCPSNITVNTSGLCGQTVSYTTPVGTDNCPGANTVQLAGLASGSFFPVGTTLNTFQVTDAFGQTATCSFTVTVVDNQPPTVSGCPSSFSSCNPISWTAPSFLDNCSVNVVASHSPGVFPSGTTTVTYTGTDPSGNVTVCSFNVTVLEPSVAPTSITSNRAFNNICQGENITLTLNGGSLGAGAVWKWYSGSCGGTLVNTGSTSITVSPSVTTTYFVRAEGTCGPTACASVTVIVSTSAPTTSGVSVVSAPDVLSTGVVAQIVMSVPANTVSLNITTNQPNSGNMLFGNSSTGPWFPAPWSTNQTTFWVQATGHQSNYNIFVRAANACGQSGPTQIRARGSVAAPVSITGPVVACATQSYTYTSAPIANTVGYYWSLIPASAGTISGGNSQTVTVTFAPGFTTAQLCVHGRTTFGLDGPDYCMTISNTTATPGAISGNASPCQGSSQTYSIAAVPGATSYNWTVLGSPVIGQNGTSITVTLPGSSFSGQVCVTAISPCGPGSTPSCLNITSGVTPPIGLISGPVTGVCGASGVNYSLSTGGAMSYLWSVPGGATIASGQGTNSINVNFTGSYAGGQISVVATYPCGTDNASLSVSGAPAMPSVTPGTLCANSAELYIASASGANDYSWTVGSGGSVFYQNPPTYSEIGIQWSSSNNNFSVTANNSCGSSPAYSLSQNCRLAADGMQSGMVEVYPNPTRGMLTVKFGSDQAEKYVMELKDLTGRSISIEAVSAVEGTNEHVMNLGGYAKGLYILNVSNSTGFVKAIRVTVE